MKKKELKDHDLKIASGGKILRKEVEVELPHHLNAQWDCIRPPTKTVYQVITNKGVSIGDPTENLSEAEEIAKRNGLSTEVVDFFILPSIDPNSFNINFSNRDAKTNIK